MMFCSFLKKSVKKRIDENLREKQKRDYTSTLFLV